MSVYMHVVLNGVSITSIRFEAECVNKVYLSELLSDDQCNGWVVACEPLDGRAVVEYVGAKVLFCNASFRVRQQCI